MFEDSCVAQLRPLDFGAETATSPTSVLDTVFIEPKQTSSIAGVATSLLADGSYAFDQKDLLALCRQCPKETVVKNVARLDQLRNQFTGQFELPNSKRWITQPAALHALSCWCEPQKLAAIVEQLQSGIEVCLLYLLIQSRIG